MWRRCFWRNSKPANSHLLAAVILSFFLREPVDAVIIVAIILLSGVLGFWQEKRAADAVKNLLAIVRIESAY